MPSLSFTPGYWVCVLVGGSACDFGNVCGSLADGFTSPNRSAAIALPSSWPGNHACSTLFTWPSHGITMGPPVVSTTTVFGFAAATALTRSSWLPEPYGAQPTSVQNLAFASVMSGRSTPSDSPSPTKTTAMSAALAAAMASACELPSVNVTRSPSAVARWEMPWYGDTTCGCGPASGMWALPPVL